MARPNIVAVLSSSSARSYLYQLAIFNSHLAFGFETEVLIYSGGMTLTDYYEDMHPSVGRRSARLDLLFQIQSSNEQNVRPAALKYWKEIWGELRQPEPTEVTDFFDILPSSYHAKMWVSLVAAAGRHCLLQPGGRLPDQGFNIYAFHRYRAMRLRLNKHVLARPSDLTVKPNPPNDPVFIEYVIFTMLRDELNIFVQAEDLGFLAGSKSSLGRIDGNGFISEVEREIHLKLLDSRIRDSYRLSGNHKEFLLSESEKYLGMGAENLALLWDENSYEMRSSCYKLLWSDTRMSDQEITEKKNEGVDGANLLRKRLRDIEVAYLNERDKWGLRPVSQNFGWHTSILAEEGSGQLLNLKAVHIVEDGRVEAYLKVIGLFGFVLGYITIVAQGPPDRCIHRVERRSKVNVDYIYDYMLEMKPKERLAIPRGSINPRAQRDILGVAFADKHDEGSKAIDPTLVKVINKVKRYPETYIKIKWEDQVTWETRSDVRRILLHEKELCILKEEMGYKINSAKQAERWDFLIYYHSRRFEQQYKATDDKN